MIAIRGAGSAIARELRALLPPDEEVCAVPRGGSMPWRASRYLFCAGLMRPCSIEEQTDVEAASSFLVNALDVMRACDFLIDMNPLARICVIGSESGYAWSFDGVYAAAKAALHRYCETRRLGLGQQLVCVAPGIIGDCGMTERREDRTNLERLEAAHPKGRFLTALEVARMVHFCLYIDHGYLSGVVIRMNGGAHTRRAA